MPNPFQELFNNPATTQIYQPEEQPYKSIIDRIRPQLTGQASTPINPDLARYEAMLKQVPTMDQYKPSIGRRIGSIFQGLQGGPAQQERYLYAPYTRAIQDWATRTGAQEQGLKVPAQVRALENKPLMDYFKIQSELAQAELARSRARHEDVTTENYVPPLSFEQRKELKAIGPPKSEPLANQMITYENLLKDPKSTPEQKKNAKRSLETLTDVLSKVHPGNQLYNDWKKQHPDGTVEQWYEMLQKGRRTGMQVYSMIRLMDQIYKYNPQLAPMIPEILKDAGVTLPEGMDFSGIPTGQPLNEEGQPIGLAMPEAPTTTTRNRGQLAQGMLPEIQRIKKMLVDYKDILGPAMGRWNEFMTGTLGGYDDPDFPKYEEFRTAMIYLTSGAAKAHLGTQIAVKDFEDAAKAGRMTPEILNAFVNEVEKWSRTYSEQGKGRPPREGGISIKDFAKAAGISSLEASKKFRDIPPAPEKDGTKLEYKGKILPIISKGGKWVTTSD